MPDPSVDRLLFILTLLAALGCGLIAGGVLRLLSVRHEGARSSSHQSRDPAMQSINVVVLNRWFLGTFLGTAILCAVAIMIGAILRWEMPNAIYLVVGSALYLVGSLLVTIVFNVPKNESLAALAPDGPRGADAWALYVSDWTAWNHVRTAASLAATAPLSLGLAA
jgi:uncharacterized membrane protein